MTTILKLKGKVMIDYKRMPKHKRQGMKTKRVSSEISGGGIHPLFIVGAVIMIIIIFS